MVTAAQAGTGAHEIEGKLWRGVLKLDYELLGCFFSSRGSGGCQALTGSDGIEFIGTSVRYNVSTTKEAKVGQ